MKHLSVPVIVLSCTCPALFAEPNTTQPALSPDIQLIAGERGGEDYAARLHAVDRLPEDMPKSDVDQLLDLLGKTVEDDVLEPDFLNAIKNDAVEKLLSQNRPDPRVAGALIKHYQSREMDPVWRDYCLQHLPRCLDNETSIQEREKILDLLWQATLQTESTFAGTALLALNRIQNRLPQFVDSHELGDRALSIAKNPSFSHPSRISALQVAGTHPEAIPLARRLAHDGSTSPLLRMAAIRLLGTSRAPEDASILQKFANSSDVRLRASARAALDR